MHLNALYGIFGRKHDLLETRNIYKKDLDVYTLTKVIKAIIPINDEIVTLLLHSKIKDDLTQELNSELEIILNNQYSLVKANVAIASAVTSYARIKLTPFKIVGFCVYSDTDSVFTTKKLDAKFIGSDLGLMKDELNGLTFKEVYFLGIKKYGYQYLDKNNNLVTKSVFAGVSRDYLSFEEIIKLSEGYTICKEIPTRFYKSLQKLSISISSTHVTISRSLEKRLVYNKYLPNHFELTNSDSKSFYNYLKRKIQICFKLIQRLLKVRRI